MLSNFDPKNIPPKFNPFRNHLIDVMSKADHMSDEELKAKLQEVIIGEKYVPRKATIILKRVH